MALETLERGLVTTKDTLLLEPGELARCDDAIYRGGSPGLWSAPGRTSLTGVLSGKTIVGGAYVEFDGSFGYSSILVAVSSADDTLYYSAFNALSGLSLSNFASTASVVPAGLSSVVYNNHAYLLMGGTTVGNRVLYVDNTGTLGARNHGMKPVLVPIAMPVVKASIAFPDGAEYGDGHYYFFVTEVDKETEQYDLESAYEGGPPVGYYQSGLVDGITVTFPTAISNSLDAAGKNGATHWRLYMVGPKDEPVWNDLWYQDATAIGDYEINYTTPVVRAGKLSVDLGGGALVAESKYAGAVDSSTKFSNPTNALSTLDYVGAASTAAVGETAEIVLKTYGFTAPAAVRGLTVVVSARNSMSAIYTTVELWNGTDWGVPKVVQWRKAADVGNHPPDNTWYVALVGDPDALWGGVWTPSEVENPGFKVRVKAKRNTMIGSPIFSLDSVQVYVYGSASSTITRGDNYPIVVQQNGPITLVVAARGAPPVASTGDIFAGQLVTNDSRNYQVIRASMPDDPDAFPSLYFINLETRRGDVVTCIRRLNSVLIVGTRNSLFRVNWFPVADDTDANSARCYDPIDEDSGIVNAYSACTFTIPGQPQLLAYVSSVGIRYTNGSLTDTLTEDIDWSNTVNLDQLGACHLVNYPHLFSLVFYYVPAGDATSTSPTRALWLNYHPTKIKARGKLAVSGPTRLGGNCSIQAYYNGLPKLVTASADSAATGTRLYLEDSGYTDAGGQTLAPDILLREIAPSGMGAEGRVDAIYLRTGYSDPGMRVTVTPWIKDVDGEFYSLAAGGDFVPQSFNTDLGPAVPGGQSTLKTGGSIQKAASDFSASSFILRVQADPIPGQAQGEMILHFVEYKGLTIQTKV